MVLKVLVNASKISKICVFLTLITTASVQLELKS